MATLRVASLLCWYDEAPAMLATSVVSLAQASVDVIVALDGAYVDYPGGRAQSAIAQHDAVFSAASSVGIEVILQRPGELWASEMEKRSALFALAEERARADWLLVLDADESILNVPTDFREQLAATDRDVVQVPYLDDPHPTLLSAEDAAGEPYVARARHVKYRRTIFRSGLGIRVEGRHSRYLTADGRCLWGDPLWGDESEPVLKMRDFVFDHRHAQRDAERNAGRQAYYRERDESLLEGRPA